jgi:hypothetical protein
MTGPRRLLEGPDATPFERDLLESWSTEQPSASARARALEIAGLATGAAVVASTAVGTVAVGAVGTAASAGSVAPQVAAAGARVGLSALAKWTIVGAVMAAGTLATVVVMRSTGRETASVGKNASASANAEAKASASASVNTGENTNTEPKAVSPADLPSVAPSVGARREGASTPRDADTLAEEIVLFDRARAALERGDAASALPLLDEYESRYRTGAFAEEAEVLRVRALMHQGDRAAATRVGERFLAAHPTSPHAARVRAILDTSKR